MFEKIALVGIGLIGSSLARVIRREGLAGHVAISTRSADDAGAGRGARPRRLLHAPIAAGGGARCRPGHRLGAGRRVGRGGRGDRAGAEAGRDPHRCRLDQGARSSRRCSRMCRPACISSPAIRWPAPRNPGPDAGFADLFENRWCIFTPLPDTDPDGAGEAVGILAPLRRQHRHDGPRASRHGARHRLAPAAHHRLQHRRHRRRSRDR